MPKIEKGRLTVQNDRDLVVLLIGARINRWWLLPLSLPILATMNRMVEELLADPESGLLGIQRFGAGAMVQYWASYEQLERYAHNPQKLHRPTWSRYYNKLFKNWAIGIWHETFLVPQGQYEAIYANMPRHGMGRYNDLLPAQGGRNASAGRLHRNPQSA